MNKDIEKLFKEAKGDVEVNDKGNRSTHLLIHFGIEGSTYTYDFDPDQFASLIIEKCVHTLVNHGYTDAAHVLETEFAEEWQKYEFPEI